MMFLKAAAVPKSTSVTVLCISLLWAASAVAGLKTTPPKNFDAAAAGSWQIDPARSDEPKPILDKAREKMASNRGGSGGMDRGGFGGDRGGGPGGGMPGGGRRGGGGGGSRGGPGGPPPGGVPPGASPQDGRGGGAPAAGRLLDDLEHNPPALTVGRTDKRVKVVSDEYSSFCMAGAVVAISDSLGSGERRCGWSGSAWVVETTRGNDFTRIDRYEAARDGKTLTYVTSVSGGRMPKIKISRTYVRQGQ